MASTLKSSCFIVKDGSKSSYYSLNRFSPFPAGAVLSPQEKSWWLRSLWGLEEGSWGRNGPVTGQRALSPFRDQWPVLAFFSVVKVPGLPEARVGKTDRSAEKSTPQADAGRWASWCWWRLECAVSASVLSSVSFFWIVKYTSLIHCLACMCALCDPMDCRLPGFSVHGIILSRILEWVAIAFSRGSSWPRDGAQVSYASCTGRWILYHCVTWEAPFTLS